MFPPHLPSRVDAGCKVGWQNDGLAEAVKHWTPVRDETAVVVERQTAVTRIGVAAILHLYGEKRAVVGKDVERVASGG